MRAVLGRSIGGAWRGEVDLQVAGYRVEALGKVCGALRRRKGGRRVGNVAMGRACEIKRMQGDALSRRLSVQLKQSRSQCVGAARLLTEKLVCGTDFKRGHRNLL